MTDTAQTEMSEMVELVRLAIMETHRKRDATWDDFRQAARAAIAAMREPTKTMWAAGGDAVVGYKSRHHDVVVKDVWQSMIDAAARKTRAIGE